MPSKTNAVIPYQTPIKPPLAKPLPVRPLAKPRQTIPPEKWAKPPAPPRPPAAPPATERATGQRAAPPTSAADHRQDATAPQAASSAAVPASAPRPPAPASAAPRKKPKPHRPMHCRECGAKSRATAGWYMLRRTILPNSIPPEILTEKEREQWASQAVQYMGCFCSFACLEKSFPRLKDLDRQFRERGTGTRIVT